MTLKVLENEFTVCKLTDLSQVRFGDRFFFILKTADETSLVCVTASVPRSVYCKRRVITYNNGAAA